MRAFLLTLAVAACTDPVVVPEPTWYGGVGAIVHTKCAGCHQPGGIAPFSLYDLADAQAQMGRMIPAIDTGLMPPFYANDAPDCTARFGWRDDPRLTADERSLVHEWFDRGGPAGEVARLPEPPPTALADASVSLHPVQAFTASGDRDQFVCFLFDPQITGLRWLTGSQVTPTAPTLVHHANVALVSPSDAAAAIAQIGGLGVPSPQCGTAPGVPIHSWLPGNPALTMRPGVAIPLAPGTLISLQVHYHPAGGSGVDASSVDLQWTDAAPRWTYRLAVYGNVSGPPHLQPDPDDPPSGPVFAIPANRADHVETMRLPNGKLQRETRIVSVTPHMHMLGTHERATLAHVDGTNECLVDSGWSFDWQRTYSYDADLADLPVFDDDSEVQLGCHWNNTFSNPMLPRLLHDANVGAPYDVQLGLTSTDEMCLADFGVITPTN